MRRGNRLLADLLADTAASVDAAGEQRGGECRRTVLLRCSGLHTLGFGCLRDSMTCLVASEGVCALDCLRQ